MCKGGGATPTAPSQNPTFEAPVENCHWRLALASMFFNYDMGYGLGDVTALNHLLDSHKPLPYVRSMSPHNLCESSRSVPHWSNSVLDGASVSFTQVRKYIGLQVCDCSSSQF